MYSISVGTVSWSCNFYTSNSHNIGPSNDKIHLLAVLYGCCPPFATRAINNSLPLEYDSLKFGEIKPLPCKLWIPVLWLIWCHNCSINLQSSITSHCHHHNCENKTQENGCKDFVS
ncbi:hypothetical protein F8388_013535 [Cannabis sativa]|uniref:Uncharacterized protein n=1 Tax=Cannabis sativa TaxID=3483 RepID=A0A7J6HU35_CANSA|nr:hypothetical protein F8388_013535 [Cannabis sativa]KAF4398411.1 hypothetical protein G4B88_025390 [Cannabis sativa]